ncbi:MAG: hypothetical protein WB772_05765 [Xanthobacteraceae bacterium]
MTARAAALTVGRGIEQQIEKILHQLDRALLRAGRVFAVELGERIRQRRTAEIEQIYETCRQLAAVVEITIDRMTGASAVPVGGARNPAPGRTRGFLSSEFLPMDVC